MIPTGHSKGAALLEICDFLHVQVRNTVFIGDNYNDREMFQIAGFSACIATMPGELQPLCDLVMGGCMEGAVADIPHAIPPL